MIPKKIHYCWFGNAPKSDLILKCIDSWKKYLPEYEICEWNESNYDVNCCAFSKDAYCAKKWAFVSDVARLKILYEHGGIYIDTDVELFVEDPFAKYLSNNAFFFFGTNVGINTGIGFGSQKNDALVKQLIDCYHNVTFTVDNIHVLTCPALNTPVILNTFPTFKLDSSNYIRDGYAFINEAEYYKFARHYGSYSWRTEEQDIALAYASKQVKVSKFRQILRKPAIFAFLRNHKLTRIENIYRFAVYDLFDYGIPYWFVRIKLKLLRLLKKKQQSS